MRHSGRYARSGNEPNTYLLFTETNSQVVHTNGRAAFIVKSSLGIDKGGQPVFQPLVQSGRIEGFYDIVNGGRGQSTIFPGVAEVERFTVLALGPGGGASDLSASMMNWSIEEARQRKSITASAASLKTLNPVTRSLPSFREPEHWEIALSLHARHVTLDFEQPTTSELSSGARSKPTNPWGLIFARLFDSSDPDGVFHKREELEADEWILGLDMVFRRGEDEALPLYEGQLVNRYDHRARTYAGYPSSKKYGKKPGIPLTVDAQKADPNYEIEPRYWIGRGTVKARLKSTIGERVAIAFRDVGAPWTNRRSARGCILPNRPTTDKLPVFGLDDEFVLQFNGLFNSTVFDFLVRGKMPAGGVRLVWMLSQIAIPSPGLDPRIEENARRLSFTSQTIAREFAADPHPWDPAERYELDVETDALVAHAYEATESEYGVILDTFDVLARKEMAEYGRYKFKEDCLAAYRRVG